MTINTQKLREAASRAKEFASVGVVQWPHTAKAHINGLADAVATCCGEIDAQAAEIARLRGLVSEMADNDTYETEYDGRMYSICHGCGAQDGEPHRRPDCLYVRARDALAQEGS